MNDQRTEKQGTSREPGQAERTEAPAGDEGKAATPGQGESTQAPETAAAGDVETLKRELEAARKRVNELAYALKESHRDREEFKQRIQRERDRLMDLERANVATVLLETVDDLDLSLNAANPEDPLVKGVRLIRDGILARLAQTGVERMEVLGKDFNPNEHEAADMEIVGVPEDDQKIAAEIRAGYKLKDRVVRPARVKVAKYVKPAQA